MEPVKDIKAIRDRLGLTQTQLAAEIGVAQGDISNWETGKHRPGRLAQRTLNASLAALLAKKEQAA